MYRRHVSIGPAQEAQTLDLALAHHQQGELLQAAELYQAILERSPAQPDALYLFGCLLYQSGHSAEAEARLRRAAGLAPEQAEYHHALGLALTSLGRINKAIDSYRRVIVLAPHHAAAHKGLADALLASGQAAEAAAAYRHLVSLLPPSDQTLLPKVWYGCGCAENMLNEFSVAQECFSNALQLQPDWLEARHNLARAQYELGHVSEAFRHFQVCAQMDQPGSEQSRAMLAVIAPGVPELSQSDILTVRQNWTLRDLPQVSRSRKSKDRHTPLRIGYVSSFFQRDNWMKPVWGLINQHDRQAVQVNLFSDCSASEIQHGYRVRSTDRWVETAALSNPELADLINHSEIDVLLDLNGYSNMRRFPLYAEKLSPVLIGWFNFYATSGLNSFDFLIGDAEAIPVQEERFFTEKILRVPASYLTFDVSYPVPPVGTRTGNFVFGSLASAYKITDQVIEAWCRILKACPETSLLIKNQQMATRSGRPALSARFERHGIAADRLHLEGPDAHYDFLRAYERIDLALDTFPYNGGTTTTEALWQGVPVVTFDGDRWAARTSASLLRAGGLAEFVAPDLEGYIQFAIRLANDPAARLRLADLRMTMRHRLSVSDVCNTVGFARHMEALYLQAVALCNKLAPDA